MTQVNSLFETGVLNFSKITDKRTIAVLSMAIDRATEKIRPSDILASVVSQVMAPGSFANDLIDLINVYNKVRQGTNTEFNGQRTWFSKEALDALDHFDAELNTLEPESAVVLELLLVHVLLNMDPKPMNLGVIFNAGNAAELFRKKIDLSHKLLVPLFDSATNRLRSDEFSESAWATLEYASDRASSMGYDQILPPHCFLALLSETEGITEHLVRLQTSPEIGPGKVADLIVEAFRISDKRKNSISLTIEFFSEATQELLKAAQRKALDSGTEQINTFHLLAALLESPPLRLKSVLEQKPLNINLQKMRQQLAVQMRDEKSQSKKEIAFHLPAGILASEDLTYKARVGTLSEALHFDIYFEPIIKALYRRENNNILITGQRGVGKTSLVYELARRAATGQIAFLKHKRFIWVDCRDVSPKDSRSKLEAIISFVGSRTDLIVCLDGFDSILRAEPDGNNKLFLRGMLKDKHVHVIGVMSTWAFDDLLASDHEMLKFFTRIDLQEPKKDVAIDIVKKKSLDLEREYKLVIKEKAIERAVTLSTNYIMSERLPTKAIDVLNRACEDADYERTQQGKTGLILFDWNEVPGKDTDKLLDLLKQSYGINWASQSKMEKTSDGQTINLSFDKNSLSIVLNAEKNEAVLKTNNDKVYYFTVKVTDGRPQICEVISVTPSDVIRIISKISGVPAGTLSGLGDREADYQKGLTLEVIGQEEAVKTVANKLRLIKSGGSEPGKPAAVMFFAGLTGTGKTELAKALATFYSSSKRLQTYTMGNFTQPHTISGIIGVPPGYVGYEQGGRLINDLNSDPYCVFLLDEAEKTHPDIWKPFLNLFDEAWVVDQRGVKAFGERAIFILTSNAGNEVISQMSLNNEPMSKITEKVKEALLKIRHDGITEPVFSPEFLARMGNIIVFKPLDEDAMKGICKKMVARMIRSWGEKKEKKLIIPENLIDYLAHESHLADKKSGFKEGGRIVAKKLVDMVELPIQQEIAEHDSNYETCTIVELTFAKFTVDVPFSPPTEPKITVNFRTETTPSPEENILRAAADLKRDLANAKDSPNSIPVLISKSLARLEEKVSEWNKDNPGLESTISKGLVSFRKACTDLEQLSLHSENESTAIFENLMASLGSPQS
jgi:ATP-dependent Clp protease ATP-binding subunit ClpA